MAPPDSAPENSPGAIEVAAALIRDVEGRYLVTRRLPGTHLAGRWEFPGGKREAGESLEACLAREIREELGAEVAVGERLDTVTWSYPEKTVALHFFRCRLLSAGIAPQHGQACRWVAPADLDGGEFPAADAALIERLRSE